MTENSPNSVALVDGIIEMKEAGDQTAETIRELSAKATEVSKGLDKILILVDMKEVGKVNMGARVEAKKVGDHQKFDAMAFVGTSSFLTHVIKWIVKVLNKNRNIRFFEKREEALTWLRTFK